MSAVGLTALLAPARAERRAVAGLVVQGWADALAWVAAAEATGSPLVLLAGPAFRAHCPSPVCGPMLRQLAERAAVPVCVQLDHGRSAQECLEALDCGFTAVMVDGSQLPLAQNIALSASVARAAAAQGVDVEGEIGYVGYPDDPDGRPSEASEAARFAAESGVDAVAVSVGNCHLQTRAAAQIDWTRLRAIEAAVEQPLVLHGGSGIGAEQRRALAADSAVCKFNIGTELRQAHDRALRAAVATEPGLLDRLSLHARCAEPLREAAAAVLRGLG